MTKKLFIPVLLGTNRQGRRSEQVARFVHAEINKRADMEGPLFDPRDFVFPSDDYGKTIADHFPAWREAVTRADGLVLIIPEYNHSIPGVMKSILDTLFEEYKHRAVGLVGVSVGGWGGVRAIEQMALVVRELGMVALKQDLHFPRVDQLFTEAGQLTDADKQEKTHKFLHELAWMAATLKYGREHITKQ